MATKIFQAYNAFLALAAAAAPTVTVYDGPQPTIPTDQNFLIIGSDDVLGGGMVVAVDAGGQDYIQLGNNVHDERFTIMSTLVAWTGDNDLPGCRARADTNISLIEAALRPAPLGAGDGMLNGVLSTIVGWVVSFSVTRLEQIQDRDGAAIHVQLALTCYARV